MLNVKNIMTSTVHTYYQECITTLLVYYIQSMYLITFFNVGCYFSYWVGALVRHLLSQLHALDGGEDFGNQRHDWEGATTVGQQSENIFVCQVAETRELGTAFFEMTSDFVHHSFLQAIDNPSGWPQANTGYTAQTLIINLLKTRRPHVASMLQRTNIEPASCMRCLSCSPCKSLNPFFPLLLPSRESSRESSLMLSMISWYLELPCCSSVRPELVRWLWSIWENNDTSSHHWNYISKFKASFLSPCYIRTYDS